MTGIGNRILHAAAGLALLLSAGLAWSATITFDDRPAVTAHGLTVADLTFDYRVAGVPSDDATYGRTLSPGLFEGLSGGVLQGSTQGLLGLDFHLAVGSLSFHVGANAQRSVSGALTVRLFAADQTLVSAQELSLAPSRAFAETRFEYAGAPISRAVIDFDETRLLTLAFAGLFALDNLSYQEAATPVSPVPIPTAIWLFASGLLALPVLGRRHPG
ncbi:MAG: hypothetical protein MUF66_01170 [Gammaproteobacteria bacterium]|jgi:hypothetical protein|nr:hypothetical protein [Gammaproteobacteria bacterium]